MKRFGPAAAIATATASAATLMLSSFPAEAHGVAAGGAAGGLVHPLLGLDHLVMLMAVGTAASFISARLLLWALGGAVIGAAVGLTGWSVPSAELLAALAVSVLGGVILLAGKASNGNASKGNPLTTLSASVVAVGVSLHAMLHGLEAPADGSTVLWWGGALLSSALVCGATYLLLKKLPGVRPQAAAWAFLAIGGLLAWAPLAQSAAGAGA
jgi:urease accessory protein